MDAGIVALFLFVAILVLLGFCLARVRGLTREIDIMRASMSESVAPKVNEPKVDANVLNGLLTNPDVLKALGGGGND